METGFRSLFFTLVILGLSVGATGSARAEAYLPTIGGGGGSQYVTPCPAGQNLGGFELRTADDVDAIRPVCVMSLGPNAISVPPANTAWTGGSGGTPRWLTCPASTPIVIGVDIEYEGVDTITVNSIHLYCGLAVATAQTPAAQPSAIFEAPRYVPSAGWGGVGIDGDDARRGWGSLRCPAGQVATGIYGKSGVWLDSMGLICDVPRMTASQGGNAVKSLGRVQSTLPPGPPRPICDVAKDARARNSPAAPGLEAQCLASKPPVKSLGRVETPFLTPAGPPRPICDVAHDARARNSPAAPGLESQCRAELATRGEAIANQDPLSAELRSRARNDLSRRGFDLGMAAAEGQTQPGPGKQAIHDALSGVEQAAFDAAVSFSLQRNRNAELAATGAAIARADPAVAQARTADSDVFYWLGFDIASGIFGDPALGAHGNTATGPGSLGIRDALNATAQRGFNASVAFHLSRTYQRPQTVGVSGPVLNASPSRSAVVISQVYGGGGSAGATLASDFVELLNRGAEPIDVTGWSIQYTSSNGATWQVTPLTGTIPAGHYFLIQEGSGSSAGTALPAPDLAGRIMLAANAGKIALIRNSTALSGFCAAVPELVDFVGYGNANCTEGGIPMPELGRATSALRNDAGCTDTDRNAADFQLGTPYARNHSAEPVSCQQAPAAP